MFPPFSNCNFFQCQFSYQLLREEVSPYKNNIFFVKCDLLLTRLEMSADHEIHFVSQVPPSVDYIGNDFLLLSPIFGLAVVGIYKGKKMFSFSTSPCPGSLFEIQFYIKCQSPNFKTCLIWEAWYQILLNWQS